MKLNNDDLLKVITRKGKPFTATWLSKKTGVHKIEIKQALSALLQEGKIEQLGTKIYALKTENIKSKKNKAEKLLTGTIDAHPDGYAFFRPENGGDDFFVPSTKLLSAVHGDYVKVKKAMFRGRPEAHVVEIVKRKLTEIVGRVEVNRRYYVVIPLHRKFTQPIFVAKSDKYADGDVVVVQFIQYPDNKNEAQGEITKRLGHIDDAGIENLIVLHKYELDRLFPKEVVTQADIEAAKPIIVNSDRTDFTKLFTVTIDGETAKDFDDAISVELENGSYTLYVHIADVANYVKPDTALDNEAYSRGTSVYFPEFAIPMLPEKLSNDICSLNPHIPRYTMTAKIKYDSDGNRVKSDFYQSVITSDHRLTYTYVNKVLNGEEKANKEITALVEKSKGLTELLMARRHRDGTLDIDMPEAEFIFNDKGELTEVLPEERGFSERVIEHFMIEANEAVSEYLEKKLPFSVYRIHDKPDMMKLVNWVKLVRSFGDQIGDVPDEITPKKIQKLFEKIGDKPYSYMIKSAMVRSMQRAEYNTENIGHFGLASKSYTHFTSPIRRYPDLMVHRLLKHLLFKYELNDTAEEYTQKARYSSERERNAEEAEREVHLYKKLYYMRKNIDEVYSCYINKVTPYGFFIFLDKLLMVGDVDGLNLRGDNFIFDDKNGTITGKRTGKKYRIGDSIKAGYLRADMDRLEAEFFIVDDSKKSKPKIRK